MLHLLHAGIGSRAVLCPAILHTALPFDNAYASMARQQKMVIIS